MKVLVADDHQLAREGLVRLLSLEKDVEVVGAAADGEEAVGLVERYQPDVLLMDVRMPRLNGIDATRRISQTHPGVAIVLITLHDEKEYLFEGLTAGARSYLLKDCTRRELMSTLRQVARGGAFIQGRNLRLLVDEFRTLRRVGGAAGRPQPCELVSRRELEVLTEVVNGRSNKEIARHLCIDETTVKTHLHRIFEKLDVRDRTQAAMLAVREGWCSLEQRAA